MAIGVPGSQKQLLMQQGLLQQQLPYEAQARHNYLSVCYRLGLRTMDAENFNYNNIM